jgi:hypothetical protein
MTAMLARDIRANNFRPGVTQRRQTMAATRNVKTTGLTMKIRLETGN